MQHRINLYLNDENPIDAQIWEYLKDKKKKQDFIKAALLGFNNIVAPTVITEEKVIEDTLDDLDDDMDGIDL